MWQDRVRPGAYSDVDNVRTVFQFEDVSELLNKKSAVFNFIGAQGAFVDNRGVNSNSYPIIAYFSGDDHDLQAAGFLQSLAKPGRGVLEHPFYGTFNVAPVGTIRRRDDLKTAANQSVIFVEFVRTIVEQYPQAGALSAATSETNVDNSVNTVSETFASAIEEAETGVLVSLVNTINDYNQQARDVLADVAEDLGTIESQVAVTLTALVTDPLAIAFDAARLIRRPQSVASTTVGVVNSSAILLSQLLGADNRTGSGTEFRVTDSYASNVILNMSLASVQGNFESRGEAIEAARFVLTALDSWIQWRDDQITNLDLVDTNETYSQIYETVSLNSEIAIDLAFNLAQEFSFILDTERTIIDLVAELYGSVDDNLDLFINSNNLSGDEVILIPRGCEVVYYG